MIGKTIAHYRIVEKIGAGGMGVVYRASDTRLGREVALKVLPDGFAQDAERLARFEREAHLLASLSHPNIAAIYGLEEVGGSRFLVLELVAGRTLAERLAGGPLSVEEALAICRQIAEALEAAHEKGIIHRDLKPANVKITPDGKVKVLDFGLAKAFAGDATGVDLSQSPTITVGATREGVVLGTAAYMSPEQARGKPLDRRTDIWSFGCVLCEALTGRQTFAGETISDVTAAILTREPDWSTLPESTPARVRDLLRRCLQKDPARRLRDIGDARLEIEEAQAELTRPQPAATATARAAVTTHVPQPAGVALWGWLALLLVAAAGSWWVRGRFETPAVPPPVRVHRLTELVGLEEYPCLSPDAKSIAFSADVAGVRQIWVRLIAGGPPLQLTRDPADHQFPRWAPDSNSLIYYTPPRAGESQGTIWEVSAFGGAPRRITDSIGGADISHDGKRLAVLQLREGKVRLVVTARDGSSPREIAQFDPGNYYLYPQWSPDDTWIAYQRGYIFVHDIFAVPAQGGEPKQITREGNLLNGFAWLADGSGVVYSSARGSTVLYLPTFNLWKVNAGGDGLQQLSFGEASYVHPHVNPQGTLVASRVRMQFDIWKYPVAGAPKENALRGVRVTQQTGHVQTPSVSPGDKELVYLSDNGGHGNLWVMKLDTGETRQITFEPDPNVALGVPAWSPDGKNIAFVSTRGNPGWAVGLWLVNPDGSNLRQIAPLGGWACWSSDSRWIYFNPGPAVQADVVKMAVESGQVVPVRTDRGTRSAVSPDGSALFYAVELPSLTGGTDYEVRAARPESGPSRVLARIPAERIPSWQLVHPVISPDGKWLALPLTDGLTTNLWALSTQDGKLRPLTDLGERRTFIARRVSWSSDGRFIFAAVGEGDADVVLLEGLQVGRAGK